MVNPSRSPMIVKLLHIYSNAISATKRPLHYYFVSSGIVTVMCAGVRFTQPLTSLLWQRTVSRAQ
jgi:hypothetical protein